MKFWIVYWDKAKNMYQLKATDCDMFIGCGGVAMFGNFDMAYDYVTKANKMTDVMAYSRWAR